MKKVLPLGAIAYDLKTPSQTLIVCLAVLSGVSPTLAENYRNTNLVKSVENNSALSPLAKYQLRKMVAAILRELNRYCPKFTYVGYRPDDPTCLGVWIDIGSLHAAEYAGKLTQVHDSKWKGVKSPYVLEFNDNGLTLYHRSGRKPIWSA